MVSREKVKAKRVSARKGTGVAATSIFLLGHSLRDESRRWNETVKKGEGMASRTGQASLARKYDTFVVQVAANTSAAEAYHGDVDAAHETGQSRRGSDAVPLSLLHHHCRTRRWLGEGGAAGATLSSAASTVDCRWPLDLVSAISFPFLVRFLSHCLSCFRSFAPSPNRRI